MNSLKELEHQHLNQTWNLNPICYSSRLIEHIGWQPFQAFLTEFVVRHPIEPGLRLPLGLIHQSLVFLMQDLNYFQSPHQGLALEKTFSFALQMPSEPACHTSDFTQCFTICTFLSEDITMNITAWIRYYEHLMQHKNPMCAMKVYRHTGCNDCIESTNGTPSQLCTTILISFDPLHKTRVAVKHLYYLFWAHMCPGTSIWTQN